MNSKYQLDGYRKFLLNRVTVTPSVTEYIENCLIQEDEAVKHSFHKVMVVNWNDNEMLFDALSDYFATPIIPVDFVNRNSITSFYTSNLNLIMKILKMDFMFPYQRNMFNVDILFNDKTSADYFENRVTIDDIVSSIVNSRLSNKLELDLSDFCNDSVFKQKNIFFYKLSLLAHFKILMLRMGRDTKTLNLSNNNISQIPLDILNFFIKGDLIAINLSHNKIPSVSELQRVISKIEKLWIEGNPLCDNIDPMDYVKKVLIKFPRLIELDGVKLYRYGITYPFFKNFLVSSDKKTKMLVEKFLTLYFTQYDSSPRNNSSLFYDNNATFSLNTSLKGNLATIKYIKWNRNFLQFATSNPVKVCTGRVDITQVLLQLPDSTHDPTTFTVDVLSHDKKSLILVVDGIFMDNNYNIDTKKHGIVYQFRRTFVLSSSQMNSYTVYSINHEMFNISLATAEQIENSFKHPIRNLNHLTLNNPEADDCNAISLAFSNITQLKKTHAESRLKKHNWDIKKALLQFKTDFKTFKIPSDMFIEEDDISDISSDYDID